MNDQLSDDDFFNDGDVASNPEQFKTQIKLLANEWTDLESEVEVTEEALANLKRRINKIKTDELPQLMREAGTSLWSDPDTGLKLELETAVNSSLPKDIEKRNAMLRALQPLGITEIVGEEMNMVFIPGDDRVPAMQRLLGIDKADDVFEDTNEGEKSELTNHQIFLIEELRKELGWTQKALPVDVKLGVHPSRLKSWLKKKIDAGQGQAIQDAGIWYGKAAKKTMPKRPK